MQRRRCSALGGKIQRSSWGILLGTCLAMTLLSCGSSSPPPAPATGSAPTTKEITEGTLYTFSNGVTCLQRRDYADNSTTKGAVEVKDIFKTEGEYARKVERVSQAQPQSAELAAAFFDICFDYGSGRITKEQYDGDRQAYDEIRQRMFPGGTPRDHTADIMEAHFEKGGFPSLQSHSPDQGPSGKCDCGPTVIEVDPGNVSGHVNEKDLHFRWDASRICLGITIDNPGGTIAFSKDSAPVRTYELPDSFGTAYMTFFKPGYYSAKLSYQGGCRNVNCGPRACSTTATVAI